MRTAHLLFQDHRLILINGIKITSPETTPELHMYVREGSEIALPVVASRPPWVLPSRSADTSGTLLLASLSLKAVEDRLWMMEECDQLEKVLLFVDTLDPEDTGSCGLYFVPPRHDVRLPHACRASSREQSTYGLVVLGPGEPLIVQSTGGNRIKLKLNEEGRFSHEPCNRIDHLLLDA